MQLLKVFAIGTAVGSVFGILFFLWIGFTGLATTESFMEGLESVETVVQNLFILAPVGGFYYHYRKLERGELLKSPHDTEESSSGATAEATLKPDAEGI